MRPTPFLLASAIALPAIADITIEDVAPPETMFIAQINDWSAMSKAFMAAPMAEIAERDDVRKIFTDLWEGEAFADLREEFARLDIEPDELPMPEGRVALAMWNELIEDADDEFAYSETHYFFLADFGERAEEMYDLMVESAEQEEKEGIVTIEFDEEGDYEVMSIVNEFDEEAARQETLDTIRRQREEWGDDFDDEFWDEMEQNILNEDFSGSDIETHAVRAGNWIALTSDRDTLSDAIEVIDGDEIDALAGNDDLDNLRNRIEGAHAEFILMPTAINDFLAGTAASIGFFLPEEIIDSLGIDQIEGAALGLTFDADDAQARFDFAMPMSGTEGIFSLIEPVGASAPPAFVPADAASYMAFGVNWGEVLPFARSVIMTLPGDERAMVEGQFAAFSIAAGPIFQSLGSDIVTYSSVERPLSATSEKTLVGIQVLNEGVISAAINQYGQMMGLEARDFLGSQIFEAPAMMGVPFAVGLGQGWAVIGEPEDIENALRRLGDDGGESLATSDLYRGAARAFEPGGASYSYADLVALFEFQQWMSKNIEDYVRASVDEEWADDEMIGWMVEDMEANPVIQFLRDAPDITTFRNAVGPTVQDLHLSEDGVTSRVLILEPTEE